MIDMIESTRSIRSVLLILLSTFLLATTIALPADGEAVLTAALADLEPYVGTWQIEATWSGGSTLWAQAEYRPVLGGRFLDGRVWVSDNGGEVYQRYHTVFAPGAAAGTVDLHTFHHDGSTARTHLLVDGPVATSEWEMGGAVIAERMEIAENTLRWQVWQVAEDGERTPLLDGNWHRVEAEPVALPRPALAEELGPLAPWLGGWEVNAAWADGTPLWSRVEYETGLAGRFVEARTWSVDEAGGYYQRYLSVFSGDIVSGDGRLLSFSVDGQVTEASVTAEVGAHGRPALEIVNDIGRPASLHQRVAMESDDVYRWTVEVTGEEATTPHRVIDARWLRQGLPPGQPAGPILADRFADRGPDLRSFTKERVIDAPVSSVWQVWASPEAWEALWWPRSRARFELAIGGRYEWLFDGSIGGNGCQVLSYIPERMLSFSWNSPPSIQDTRLESTWVVVETEPLDGTSTRIRLTHLGFGDGPAWDETYAYFDRAWESVLERMAAAVPGTAPPE